MAYKKINKKGGTMISVIVVLLLVIGCFGGFYIFVAEQFDNYGTELDSKYNETYQVLLEEQTNIDNDVENIKDTVNDIEEADNTFLAAINGFKGLGNVLLLLLGFVSSGFNVFTAFFFSTDFIPNNIQDLLIVGIISAILLIVVAILKGESRVTN